MAIDDPDVEALLANALARQFATNPEAAARATAAAATVRFTGDLDAYLTAALACVVRALEQMADELLADWPTRPTIQ